MTHVEKLVSISSEPLACLPSIGADLIMRWPLGSELFHLLERKNGFYAFESALHVFPESPGVVDGASLAEWNSESCWRGEYGDLTTGLLFFAENAFQDQYCLGSRGILRFNAESGGTQPMANSIEEWAAVILRDYEHETGWALASEWQRKFGALMPGKRLLPKTPFFLGGSYSTDNLWAGDAVDGMRFKADVATQTRYIPDGTQVRLVVGKKPAN